MERVGYKSLEEIQNDLRRFGSREIEEILIYGTEISNILFEKCGSEDWSNLKGLSVLDLGCGSGFTPRTLHLEGWPPYFCGLCAANGARVYGIDLYDPDPFDAQDYNHIKADLVSQVLGEGLSELNGIKGVSFDIVHTRLLVGGVISRDLRRTLGFGGVTIEDFKGKLEEQAKEMLNDGGILYMEGKALFRKISS